MKTKKIFSKKLVELREERKLTKKELAEKLKISAASLGYYENGERLPDISTACKIADFFDITCDELLRGIKSENVSIYKKTGLTESALKTLEKLNSSLDLDNTEKERILKKQKDFAKSIDNDKFPFVPSLTEEEISKLHAILQEDTNKKILNILNDILTISTGREWETYGMQILNTIYNYCKGEYENAEIKRNDLAGTTYYEISADTQRNMELYTLNNILTEMRNILTAENDLPLYTTNEMIELELLPKDFDEKEVAEYVDNNPEEE